MKWLDMVWDALSEQDSDKRIHMLDDANCFLARCREAAGQQGPELTASVTDCLSPSSTLQIVI